MTSTVQTLETLYFRVTDIWKRFCEEHTLLLDLTFEEYGHLLSSDLSELEQALEKKNVVIKRISNLESMRKETIRDLNSFLANSSGEKINDVSELLKYMQSYEIEKKQKHLYSFNTLLVDVIEKLKEQNKRNQLFLNKAIHSLKDIKDSAFGLKSYSTYNNSGVTKSNTVP
jgi:flagellar biosynthesis/type III secretory pathway chaperone